MGILHGPHAEFLHTDTPLQTGAVTRFPLGTRFCPHSGRRLFGRIPADAAFWPLCGHRGGRALWMKLCSPAMQRALAAVVQMTSTSDVEANLASVERLVRKAASRGAAL